MDPRFAGALVVSAGALAYGLFNRQQKPLSPKVTPEPEDDMPDFDVKVSPEEKKKADDEFQEIVNQINKKVYARTCQVYAAIYGKSGGIFASFARRSFQKRTL